LRGRGRTLHELIQFSFDRAQTSSPKNLGRYVRFEIEPTYLIGESKIVDLLEHVRRDRRGPVSPVNEKHLLLCPDANNIALQGVTAKHLLKCSQIPQQCFPERSRTIVSTVL
jgi:hypothetical protein